VAVVASGGQIASIQQPWWPRVWTPRPVGVPLYGDLMVEFGQLYRSQPAVRRVVSFLARNIAQIGIHVYERVADADRRRADDHPLAHILGRPNPYTTRYRLMDSLIHDLAVYDNAYWVKQADPDPAQRMQVIRIPPQQMLPADGTWLQATEYVLVGNFGRMNLDASQVVHFRGYNPHDPRQGCSPLETLRRVLAEEEAMGSHREGLWRNGARFEGVLTRPVDAPRMSPEAKDRFWARWNASHAGSAGSGSTALLEEGMAYQQTSFSAKDAQYLESRKLNTEEVAAAYHVPLPMVGILDHATFSNVTEQHKNLYQDCLGPWLVQIEQEIMLQLLPELTPNENIYCEFNLDEKLRGNFQDQARYLQVSVGAPYVTRNEARAWANLPPVEGGDVLATPLNLSMAPEAPTGDEPTATDDPSADTTDATATDDLQLNALLDGARLAKGLPA